MSMDAIHVHTKKGGEHGKVKGNITPKIDDCLWTVHESWCCVKPPSTLNKQLQEGQGMWGHKGEICMMDTGKSCSGCGGRGRRGLMN
jgi:hypothetical protein